MQMATLNFNANSVQPAQGEVEAPRARSWSQYQQNIFSFVQTGTGNAIVKAVAGSGKTTTIVHAMEYMQGSSIFLAFNKSIADELKSRGVNARTFHSLVYSAVLKHKRQNNVEKNKKLKVCDQIMTGDERTMYGSFCMRLVGLAMQVGIGCLVPDTDEAWQEIVNHHDIEPDSEFADLGRGIELARKLFDACYRSPLVDFDDMMYLAVRDGISLPKFANVVVDEGQDTNAIQRAIIRKIMGPNARLLVVGDDAQAIYGFRGADSDSLNMIAREFNCIELPLSITYRCPQAVVSFAQQWVANIEAAPNAPEGEVASLGTNWNAKMFQSGDLVVCRTSRPVVALAYKLLRARVPVRIQGKEIGQGLKNLINKMNARTIDQLEIKLDAWCAKEVEKAVAKMEEAKAEAVQDKVAAIKCLIEGLEEGSGIYDLIRVIDTLFDENTVGATVLSTIHRAKGLEAGTVYWLNSSQCPAKWARQGWQMQQEENLCYVAATRAKNKLVLIEEPRE
jgi:DNA helicase-2/ATP-dependent DNA helicase PcrA